MCLYRVDEHRCGQGHTWHGQTHVTRSCRYAKERWATRDPPRFGNSGAFRATKEQLRLQCSVESRVAVPTAVVSPNGQPVIEPESSCRQCLERLAAPPTGHAAGVRMPQTPTTQVNTQMGLGHAHGTGTPTQTDPVPKYQHTPTTSVEAQVQAHLRHGGRVVNVGASPLTAVGFGEPGSPSRPSPGEIARYEAAFGSHTASPLSPGFPQHSTELHQCVWHARGCRATFSSGMRALEHSYGCTHRG